MKNRTYNILFHTHTVSGIVISVVLYIIFFAGSFSFFRDEIVNWERNDIVNSSEEINSNLNIILDSLEHTHALQGRDVEIKKYFNEQKLSVSISASKDTLAPEEAKIKRFFYLDTKTFKQESYIDSYSLGEFLYRLHFLAQVKYPIGYYVSGFVALFFLFAIVTGVLVHWKKIISNFYVFRPLEKLKTMWTDAHTTLGVLGLPFQFVYAVTGAFFMIKLLLVAPSIAVLYDGDQRTFYDDLEYSHPNFESDNLVLSKPVNINSYVDATKRLWDDFLVNEIHIFNYNDENMHVSVSGHLDYKQQFNGVGGVIFKAKTNEIVLQKNPVTETSYLDIVKNVLFRIHYGDYGGYALKTISFLLGLITCFVIMSGVMIWLVARDKKSIPEKKRRFNERVVRIYLAICLSMYPITALSFIAVKITQPVTQAFIYNFYFIGWLLFIIWFLIKRDNSFTNKTTMFLGSVFGLFVPVVNGVMTGNWIWESFTKGYDQIFIIDLFWILLSIVGFSVFLKLNKKSKIDKN
ncbi:PepSY domain-containing protein [Cellulophaga sp. HaHaR_3_176]|uniref:PepSY-associated TM helix domain-containing protein n=1 Tax=Cellulophaga sp. HaHaR_3_176 TaxID=1942464 RepID=UPI001C1FEFC6|nr:PepSY-associated TM helix domain-containing protein [Cellulophaga sp. HaHaR_3_176]QWX84643.1 PepSY domain-containing protein [Cellulophaga sp. HaHaR_3_176]